MVNDMKSIIICTVVYYDGIEAYTTQRALWVDFTDKMKLTSKSSKALKADMEMGGVELLKVDFNGREFDNVNALFNQITLHDTLEKDESSKNNILSKFAEYFVEQ